MIDWNIRLGDILDMATLAGGVVVFAFKSGAFSKVIENIQAELGGLKEIQDKLAIAVTKIAVQDEKLNSQDKRLNILDERIEDLRHGRGFIIPRQLEKP